MNNYDIHPRNRDYINNMIASVGRHLQAILIAVRDQGIWTCITDPEVGPFSLPYTGRPFVAVLDDDTGGGVGPRGFHRQSLDWLLARCGAVVLSDCTNVELYCVASVIAVFDELNVTVIETARVSEWVKVIARRAPRIQIITKPPQGWSERT